MNATKTLTNGLIGTAAFFALSLPVGALAGLEVSFDDQAECNTILAGQYIEAGEVCVAVQGDYLSVTYHTVDDWELKEAQLWTGLDMALMPATKNGNPKIGNFPYNSGDITGATSYSFSVPLEKIFGAPPADLDLCGVSAYLAAHSSLQRPNGSGGYETQTGWVDGEQMVAKGSWAMYSSLDFTCPPEPETVAPVQECSELGTGYAVGEKTFLQDGDDLTIGTKWGWQITVPAGDGVTVRDIYVGAGQNDLRKGTLVGTLTITRLNGDVQVAYAMDDGFVMSATHLYVGTKYVATTAPGLYGNLHDPLDNASDDSYTVADPDPSLDLYVVAHAAVGVCE
jgi:hypothetical protein